MESVVKSSIYSLKRVSSKSLTDLLNRALLLWNVQHSARYSFIQACLVDFAVDFVKGLQTGGTTMLTRTLENDSSKISFVRAVSYVIGHGAESVFNDFGNWATIYETRLAALLKIVAESNNAGMAPQRMILDILNKCLVQQSVTLPYGWPGQKKEDGSVPRSIHVRRVLDDYPDTAQKMDSKGRFTLHHACANTSTSFETVMNVLEANPKGVSVRDPVSGLYPFMLAASKDNVAASFSLLLANPSLVLGGTIQVDAVDAKKKRKRSPSMG